MVDFTYLESTDDSSGNSLQRMGFSLQAGSVSAVYQFDLDVADTSSALQNAVNDINGYTYTDVNSNQKLRRILPVTHPAFPYLYASKVTGMQGFGCQEASRDAEVLPPITGNPQAIADTFYLYPTYKINVNFDTLPYTILPDEQVNIKAGTWWPDGVLASTAPTSFTYAGEWVRYTDYNLKPQSNNIQGSTGAFTFKDLPSKPIFTNPPFFYLPDSILEFTWYQVPYRYITSTNSYIANRGWRGRINQNAWYNWPAGSLLYLNYDYRKYTQPSLESQSLVDLNGNSWDSYSKLCDITFTFLYTARTAGTTPTAPKYGNWIAKGHNLQPFLPTRSFEYCTATGEPVGDDTKWYPTWNSFPLEALFSDPDTAGGP